MNSYPTRTLKIKTPAGASPVERRRAAIKSLVEDRNELQKLISGMEKYGGNFAKCIAAALVAADANNKAKLLYSFPEFVEKYGPGGLFNN